MKEMFTHMVEKQATEQLKIIPEGLQLMQVYLNVELHDWTSVANSHGAPHEDNLNSRQDFWVQAD